MKIGKISSSAVHLPKQFQESSKFSISREVGSSIAVDRNNLWSFLVSVCLLAALVGIVSFYFQNLPPVLPIFYSMTWGDGILADKVFIWTLPIISATFIVFNLVIYFIFFRSNKFLARILFLTSAVIGFTTFWGAVKIITLLV